MIEKLKLHQVLDNNGKVYAEVEPDNTELREVINEIIDVINALVEENNIHEKQIDKLQMKQDERMIGSISFDKIEGKMNPEPTDQFAEQRKWIGKLCKFWDNDDTQQLWYGVLTKINTESRFGVQYCCNDEYDYDNCEPVKPNDSIIYQGE